MNEGLDRHSTRESADYGPFDSWCQEKIRRAAGRCSEAPRALGDERFYLSRRARSFSFSLQTDSRMSVSGSSSSVTLIVNDWVYIFGSSTVTLRSMWPKSRRWNR